MADYLLNIWYMAAWSEEVEGGFLARTLLDRPILLYRLEDGTPIALHDMCPHRFAPLSMGRRYGDSVECAYHGLRFDSDGRCILNPFSDIIPAAAKVGKFPLVERHGALWIWLGDLDAADASLIADLSFMDDPSSRTVRSVSHAGADYRLLVDNLMDLSHIQFLHPTTFGNDAIAGGTHEVRQEGRAIHSNRWSPE